MSCTATAHLLFGFNLGNRDRWNILEVDEDNQWTTPHRPDADRVNGFDDACYELLGGREAAEANGVAITAVGDHVHDQDSLSWFLHVNESGEGDIWQDLGGSKQVMPGRLYLPLIVDSVQSRTLRAAIDKLQITPVRAVPFTEPKPGVPCAPCWHLTASYG